MRQILSRMIDWYKMADRRIADLVASDSVRVFEIQLLLFPVFAVLLASLALMCGGRCSLWQWWTAIVLAVLVSLIRHCEIRPFAFGTGLFAFVILALWVAGGISIVPLGDDPLRYHLPGIRLLTEGWNPVWQGRWDLITANFGIDPSETKTLFILPNAKSVWYLDALAYFFIRNPFNMMFPAYFLLVVVSGITLLRSFPNANCFVRLMMALAMIGIVPPCCNSIDTVVGLAGICLLTAMHKCIAHEEWDWCELLGYSFWMCTAKQTALLHCFIFWSLFTVVLFVLRRRRSFLRLTLAALCLSMSVAIVGASPYFSSWKEFGHPLYPKRTVAPERFPAYNMVTCDFLTRNEDAAAMGHIGAYVHSYISPEIIGLYYRHKLNKDQFAPWCFCLPYPDILIRFAFCGCLFLILLFGKLADRMIVVCVCAGTLAMPTEMIGFTRYCPWYLAGIVFVMPLLARRSRFYHLKYILLLALVWKTSVRTGVALVSDALIHINRANAGMEYLVSTPPKQVYNGYNENHYDTNGQEYFDLFFTEKGTKKRGDDVNKTSLGNLKLLVRQSSFLKGSQVVDLKDGSALSERFRNSCGAWESFYDNSFKVPPENALPHLQSALKTMFYTFPELIMRRMTWRFGWT